MRKKIRYVQILNNIDVNEMSTVIHVNEGQLWERQDVVFIDR